MATTVPQAFEEFLRDKIRIDPEQNKIAKASKDELLRQILNLPADGVFPELHTDIPFIQYGSYARKTKVRPLDDIDIMIVLHAHSAWYDMYRSPTIVDNIHYDRRLGNFIDDNGHINSTKVINAFIKNLSKVRLYRHADFKKNGEAAELELQSYNWKYDIVPCFITNPEPDGRTFFLIPDGKGGWKKTDPRLDKARVEQVNANHNFSILDVVRLIKYWNKRNTMSTIPSYLLENIVLDFFDGRTPNNVADTVRGCFLNVLHYIGTAIHSTVTDPKGIQGNLNSLTIEQRNSIAMRAQTDYGRGYQAFQFEASHQQNLAINTWRQIFGEDFPTYP